MICNLIISTNITNNGENHLQVIDRIAISLPAEKDDDIAMILARKLKNEFATVNRNVMTVAMFIFNYLNRYGINLLASDGFIDYKFKSRFGEKSKHLGDGVREYYYLFHVPDAASTSETISGLCRITMEK